MNRLHALDGLRAAMMLLGLVLHSAASYTVTPLGAGWPYQDPNTNAMFDLVVFVIHLFRMPVFFVMAGFFAALLYSRDGGRGFLVNRTKRVLVPLAAAWVVVFPLVASGFGYAMGGGGWTGLSNLPAQIASTDARPNLAHLWFLYDLFIFYLAAAAVAPLLRRLPVSVLAGLSRLSERLVPGPGGVAVFSLVTMATLLPMSAPAIETSPSFVPPLRVLAAYVAFFAVGWLLFARREVVVRFGRRAWQYVCAAVVASGAYLVIVLAPASSDPMRAHLMGAGAAALAIWLWVYAFTGVFVRYFDSPRRIQRYLSDASYWIYLIHLPFTIWLPGLLQPFDWPAVVKFSIVLGTTVIVTVGTYHWFVRSTAIGAALNGRRYD